MSAGHSAEHERWIEQALLGETPLEPSAAAELEACEPCRRSLTELRRLRARLDEAGGEARAVISASQAADPVPEAEATVREFLARLEPPPVVRTRRKLVWVAALAAAAVLAAAWLYRRDSVSPQGRAPIMLGTGVIILDEPVGPVEEFATFSWHANVGRRTHFSILIWSDEVPEGKLLDEVPLGDDTFRWTPTPEMLKRWPDSIRWGVRAQEEAADHEEWTAGAASRSRH